MPRLYREAPLNSIWEGSGNVICLDVLRAMARSPQSLEAFFAEVERGAPAPSRGCDASSTGCRPSCRTSTASRRARAAIVERLALALQGSLLVRYGDPAVADAFCASRLAATGAAPSARCRPASTSARIIERHTPAYR